MQYDIICYCPSSDKELFLESLCVWLDLGAETIHIYCDHDTEFDISILDNSNIEIYPHFEKDGDYLESVEREIVRLHMSSSNFYKPFVLMSMTYPHSGSIYFSD